MNRSYRYVLFLGCAILVPAFVDSATPSSEEGAQETIDRLIQEMGSKEYRIRDQATRKLKEVDKALPVLLRAKPAMDLEMRQRAEMVIGALRERAIRALLAKGKDVEVDLLIEQIFAHKQAVDDSCWRVALDLAKEMVAWAQKNGGRSIHLPQADFLNAPWLIAPGLKLSRETRAEDYPIHKRVLTNSIVAHGALPPMEKCLVLCEHSFPALCGESVVFVNGNINPHRDSITPDPADVGILWRSVIFCDGDIRSGEARESLLVATGKITIKYPGPGNVVVEYAANPLQFMKLFDTSALGIAIRPVHGRLVIAQVEDGKPFARGGIQKGDVLLAVKETKGAVAVQITSPDVLRREIRRLVVHHGQGVFQIQRGGNKLELVVPF